MSVAVWKALRHGYGTRRPFSLRFVYVSFRKALWSLGAPVIVLGGILSGIVTVTEAAALAVFYALLVAMWVNRQLSWREMPGLLVESQVIAATILFIIAMAKVFTWLVAMQQTPAMLQSAIATMALPPWGLLLLVMAGLLVVGCVMETIAALILLVPVLAPLTVHMGVDLMHFGVLMAVNPPWHAHAAGGHLPVRKLRHRRLAAGPGGPRGMPLWWRRPPEERATGAAGPAADADLSVAGSTHPHRRDRPVGNADRSLTGRTDPPTPAWSACSAASPRQPC